MGLRNFILREHEATYVSSAVYYTFAFSLPPGTDIYKLADTLLQHDLATAAGSVSRGVRYAHRFQEVQKNRKIAETLATLRDVEEGKLRLVRWMARNPSTALLLLRKKLVRVSRSKREKPNPELIKIYEGFSRIPTELDDKMADAGLILGSQVAVDEFLLSPDYLSDEPFIRLDLDSVFVESDLFADPEIMMSLLLHKSGVALLTFAATPGGGLTTDNHLSVSSSNQVTFTKTFLDEALGKLLGRANKDRVIEDKWNESEDGIRWRETSWRDPLPLQELFQAYSELIITSTKRRAVHSPWMCYTTLFVDGIKCCSNKTKWLKRHTLDLAGLIARQWEYTNAKPSFVKRMLAREHGIRRYESKYFGAGNALLLRWHFRNDAQPTSGTDHLPTITIVQGALLQYWQLLALDARFTASRWKTSDLIEIQRQIIAGLDEYRGAKLMWEEAKAEEKEITSGLGIDTLYARILDRLGAIDQLMTARATIVGTRRNLLIAGLGSFATLLLGLPALKDLLDIVRKLDTSTFPAVLLRPLASFANDGPAGAWNLYVILVGIAVGTLAVSLLMRVRDVRKQRRGEFGLGWDVTYEIIPPSHSKGKLNESQADAPGE